ncbi:MAG: ABC transporter permease [Halanaerobiaceae bacterium]
MKLGEYIRLALSEIYHNKVRTFLTLIGIVIGIAAVIVIIFVVQGAETYLLGELESYVPLDLIQVFGRWDSDAQRYMANLTNEDLKVLEKEMGDEISAIAPQYRQNGAELRYKDQIDEIELVATIPSFQHFYDMIFESGRFFSEIDVEDFNNVIVLGYETAERLFDGQEAIGKKISIHGNTFTVIAVLEEAYTSPIVQGGTDDNRGFIPISAFERMYGVEDQFFVFIRAADMSNLNMIEKKIIQVLDQRHGMATDGNSKFRAYNVSQDIEMFNIITIVLMVLLSGVASITLLVAGIGIMNIMLVIITERTREIGLRKAIGAKRSDILFQFIIESIILCLLGGILGILLGYFGSNMVSNFASNYINIDIDVPGWSVVVSILFTSFVGLFFGIYPAAKAARLDPIKALHYE